MAWILHRFSREVLPFVVLGIVLALLGGFSWLTHHPQAEVIRQAEEWPLLGPLATQFRLRYAPSPLLSAPDLQPEIVVEDRQRPEIEVAPRPQGELMWLLPGAVLRQRPRPDGAVVEELEGVTRVVRLEQRDTWYRVHANGLEGWVYIEDYAAQGPPYGNEPEAPGPLPGRDADPEELAAARQILGDDAQTVALGPYTTYTDCRDEALLRHLDGLATHLEASYSARYGRLPLGTPKATVVLFREAADYSALRDRLQELAGLPASGHHSRGLVVLFAGDRRPLGIGSTLVHELVHTLNRRAIGPALPPWLDEGLADDLAASRVAADGRLMVEQLNGSVGPQDGHVLISGALASLVELRRAQIQGRLPSLRRVLNLDWEGFVRSDDISLHYDFSAFWVRFLLQGQNRRYAASFGDFLNAVANGAEITEDELLSHLGHEMPLLEAGVRNFLEFLVQQHQLPPILPGPGPPGPPTPEVPTGSETGEETPNGSSSRQTDSPSL